jgi:hypothetical protein
MTHLHCPSCGKRVEIDLVEDFTARWSMEKCLNCGVELSIRYDPGATFVKYRQKEKISTKKVHTVA